MPRLSHTSAYALLVITADGVRIWEPDQCVLTVATSATPSALELLPKLKADGTPVVKKLNRYAQFVKENYATMKLQTPGGSHKNVMEKLKTAYYKKDDATTSSSLNRSFSA